MGTRSHKAALVDVFDIAVFVFLGGIDDDIVDKPAVDIGAVAREIKNNCGSLVVHSSMSKVSRY